MGYLDDVFRAFEKREMKLYRLNEEQMKTLFSSRTTLCPLEAVLSRIEKMGELYDIATGPKAENLEDCGSYLMVFNLADGVPDPFGAITVHNYAGDGFVLIKSPGHSYPRMLVGTDQLENFLDFTLREVNAGYEYLSGLTRELEQ